ncbi:murein transglycosylase A [Aestuariibius sp. 2305UL40-4]|uniref:murein transglycosylase A n=1 Tax=Aestuariibius violaceus TaxID=3234132 RepID=UPI00345ECE39
MADPAVTVLRFSDLEGWAADDHEAALSAFLETCGDLNDPDWLPLCSLARSGPGARAFFEQLFTPVLVEDGVPMLFTGYFEPELEGSLTPDETFAYPIYRKPPEILDGVPWLTRQEIEESDVLDERGLELFWLSDPVDLFFLQVQGSGRIRLPDGSLRRVGYGGKNGREYSSVGLELVRRGLFEAHEVSAATIRNWVRDNPEEGRALLQVNESYVFFRPVDDVPPEKGPLGAMNRSVTEMRSVAVDPEYVPLGAPVWIEKEGADPMRRLMIAQDTGSAIKGAQRADIFFGTGEEGGRAAGRIRDGGRMVVLLPIQRAYAMADAVRR